MRNEVRRRGGEILEVELMKADFNKDRMERRKGN